MKKEKLKRLRRRQRSTKRQLENLETRQVALVEADKPLPDPMGVEKHRARLKLASRVLRSKDHPKVTTLDDAMAYARERIR